MSDITKCTNEDCKLKESCYRFTAPAHDIIQAYDRFEPAIVKDLLICEYQLENYMTHEKSPD